MQLTARCRYMIFLTLKIMSMQKRDTLSKKSSWTLTKVHTNGFILDKLKAYYEAGECPLQFDTKLEGIV